jgi:hypothetical protein
VAGSPSFRHEHQSCAQPAEREQRAKVIANDGEFQAAQVLANAAEIISTRPAALALRYMQTLLDMGSNQNSTIVLSVPIELIRPLLAAPVPMKSVAAGNGGIHERPRFPAGCGAVRALAGNRQVMADALLRHQLATLQRSVARPRVTRFDRIDLVPLAITPTRRNVLRIVRPETLFLAYENVADAYLHHAK